MYCENPVFKGDHWQVGDQKTVKQTLGSSSNPIKIEYESLQGWWEYEDGEDGGDLELFLNKEGVWEVNDFDGAFDLPDFIKVELESLGIEVDF